MKIRFAVYAFVAGVVLLFLSCCGGGEILKLKDADATSRILPGDSLYRVETILQPDDYSGTVISTLLSRKAGDSRKAILYIHGFNDYFFNHEMADSFCCAGYNFYALDLRKYGRSLLPGQRPFEVRNLNEYFPDIDSALVHIAAAGNSEVALMGHSTGGLISAYYVAENPGAKVDALVLNSPFLDWNLGWKENLVPVIAWWGGMFPATEIRQSPSRIYARSLLKSEEGYHSYDTTLKMPQSPAVTAGWIRAISRAQRRLRNHHGIIRQPILLMVSQLSYHGDDAGGDDENESSGKNRGEKEAGADPRDLPLSQQPLWMRSDAVLDVNDIRQYGELLGPDETLMIVNGGLHDLFLSNPRLTAALYPGVIAWLNRTL